MFSLWFCLFLDSDDAIGTHCRTECTTYTFFLILDECRGIALCVKLVGGDLKTALGTSADAKTAALAHIGIKSYLCHSFLLISKPLSFGYVKIFLLQHQGHNGHARQAFGYCLHRRVHHKGKPRYPAQLVDKGEGIGYGFNRRVLAEV